MIHFHVALFTHYFESLHMFAHITLQIAWKGGLFSKRHVELILITPFQAYLTDDSSNAVFIIKITFRSIV